MNNLRKIGFSQRIQSEWLEYAANLVLSGKSKDEIKILLNEYLKDKISVGTKAKRSNRDLAVDKIINIWVKPPKNIAPLRNDSLELFKNLPKKEHLPLHWSMTIAVYPFFGFVAAAVGRLLRLQTNFTPSQVYKRLKETLGEREAVFRAARRILRVFVDWEVLKDTYKKGVYEPASVKIISNSNLAVLMVEATLFSIDKNSESLNSIIRWPGHFPFNLNVKNLVGKIEFSERLEVHKLGLIEDVVSLKKERSRP